MTKDNPREKWALPRTVVKAGENWALVCGRCNRCGTVVFPRPPICPVCLDESLEPDLVCDGGILYSYSIVHAVRAGWTSPYGLAYVDFPNGVRICGPLDIPADGHISLDSPVSLTVGELRVDAEGVSWLSHRFSALGSGAKHGKESMR
ncbi:hypothetical protein GCM10009097_34630 [Pigmentiphaga daeguensis]|uniref:DUF35 domain-containing protein n=2 Tax=Pigmentiphaga daeguensis TaxID=414049 RepID=A0ABP3M748_9BURK